MKPAPNPWNRLLAAARPAHAASTHGDDSAPSGFATRIVALAGKPPSSGTIAIFERLALRALGCALLVMLASAAWNLTPTATAASADERSADLLDPVGEVLQLVQAS